MSISCPPIHNIVSIRGVTTTSNSEYYPEVEDFDMDFEDFDIDIDSADDVDSYAFDAEDEVDFEDEDAGPLGCSWSRRCWKTKCGCRKCKRQKVCAYARRRHPIATETEWISSLISFAFACICISPSVLAWFADKGIARGD